MNFTKWLISFISKCLKFYPCFFFWKHAYTHRYELYKMGFVSSQNVWILIPAFFWKYAHTHKYWCYKVGRFFIPIFFWKHAHTHRYEFNKMADLFHLKMSEFLSFAFFWKYAHTHRYQCYKDGRFFTRIFGQNTHARTDINVTQWMISFSFQNVLLFILGFFLKTRTHAQMWMF